MNRAEKQALFVNEVTFEFLEILLYQNNINQNRAQAQPGVVQNLVNQIANVASSAASPFPGASQGFSAINALLNYMKNAKHEERRATVNADVLQHLKTKIHNEVKQAAIRLSQCFAEYIDTRLDLQGIKVFADCVAHRMFNYMSKEATEESQADAWSYHALIQGAFEGVSGSLKTNYRNTVLQTNETNPQPDRVMAFNYHAPTVEGLLTHTAFVTKDDKDDWVFYKNKAWDMPLEKYGLAVFPREIAIVRLEAIGRLGEKYEPFVLSAKTRNAYLEQMTRDWDNVSVPIEFTPVQSNEELSARHNAHTAILNQTHVRITNLENVVQQLAGSLSEQQALEMQKCYTQQERTSFIQNLYEQECWKHLAQAEIADVESYPLNVDTWLVSLEQCTQISVTQWRECLTRAALAEFAISLNLFSALAPWEKSACTLTQEDQSLILSAPAQFPVKKIPHINGIKWESLNLYYYFLSFGLWELYQTAKALSIGEHSQIWQKLEFKQLKSQALFQQFLHYWSPTDVERFLLEDCQMADVRDFNFLSQNIDALFATHKALCTCTFCQGREEIKEIEGQERRLTGEVGVDFAQKITEKVSDMRWVRLLPEESAREVVTSFSPDQPQYLQADSASENFGVVAWHWPEAYLSKRLGQRMEEEFKNFTDKSKHYLVALIPAAGAERAVVLEEPRWQEDINDKLLSDQNDYIESMLTTLTLENPKEMTTRRLFATYEEAQAVFLHCHQKFQDEEVPRIYRQTFKNTDYPENVKNALASLLQSETAMLNDYFLALQDENVLAGLINVPASRYKNNVTLRREHLQLVTTSLKYTQQVIAKRKREADSIIPSNSIEALGEHWKKTQLTPVQVRFILDMLIFALELRTRVILNYIKGSEITLGNFQIEAWEQPNETNMIADVLRKRDVVSPGSPPLVTEHENALIKIQTPYHFDRALTVNEIWVRAQRLHSPQFWHAAGKKYSTTVFYQKGKTWEKDPEFYPMSSLTEAGPMIGKVYVECHNDIYQYQTHLTKGQKMVINFNELSLSTSDKNTFKQMIRSASTDDAILLPDALKRAFLTMTEKAKHTWKPYKAELLEAINKLPALSSIFAHKDIGNDAVLKKELRVWEATIRAKKSELEKQLSTRTERLKKREHHVKGALVRFGQLLHVLPPAIKKAYEALATSKKNEWEEALKCGNAHPMAEWLCHHFNRERPILFQTACMHALSQCSDSAEYQEKCTDLLTEFKDTRQVWEAWPKWKKIQWVSDLFDGKTNVWQEFLREMEGKWHPLKHNVLKHFLTQGLHPDATYKNGTVLRLAITEALRPDETQTWDKDYFKSIKDRFEIVYYLLDCNGVTHDWSTLLNKVAIAYKRTTLGLLKELSNESHVETLKEVQLYWLNLAAALLAFQGFDAKPAEKINFLNTLSALHKEVDSYKNNFSESQKSTLKNLFRTSAMIANRIKTHQHLDGYASSIPFSMSHLSGFLSLLTKLKEEHVPQFKGLPSHSRLNKLVGELHKIILGLFASLEVWKNMAEKLALSNEKESRASLESSPLPMYVNEIGTFVEATSPIYESLTFYDSDGSPEGERITDLKDLVSQMGQVKKSTEQKEDVFDIASEAFKAEEKELSNAREEQLAAAQKVAEVEKLRRIAADKENAELRARIAQLERAAMQRDEPRKEAQESHSEEEGFNSSSSFRK